MFDDRPRIKRIGLAIEMTDGQIVQVYSDHADAAEVTFDYHNDIDHVWGGSMYRTVITDSWLDIHITGIRRNWVKDYRPGTGDYPALETQTRTIAPPPHEGIIEP